MGDVYKARDIRLRRDVALKVLPELFAADADRLARFTREAQTLASLNHPHIAQIYGLEEAPAPRQGQPPIQALAMELVVGNTLEQVINARTNEAEQVEDPSEARARSQKRGGGAPRGLEIDDALAIARQVAEALVTAHDKGVVHRDLKPGNLIITADGTVKVLDFGLAKTRDAADEAESSARRDADSPTELKGPTTDAGVVLGTAAYMSPEQARGEPVDKRTDIWAFGCVLYEMLAGRRTFVGRTVTDTLAAIMRDQPDWSRLPPETPLIVRWLVERCLEKDVKRRLHDLGDARLMLDDGRLLSGGATVASPAAAKPRRASRAALVAGASVLLAALGTTGTVAVRHWREVPARERSARFAIVPPEGMQLGDPIQVALSSDGESLVFSIGSGEAASLWVRPVRSLNARPLTGTAGAILPFWSPDSKAIGFFASGKLKLLRIDSGQVSTVCDAATGRGGTWGRDDVIVFTPAADAPLMRVNAAGGMPVALTKLDPPRENSHRSPSFLPDGRHFLFLSGGQAAAGGVRWQVKAGSLHDSTVTTVVTDTDIGSSPAYSAGHVLFARNRALMALPFDPDTRQASGTAFAVGDEALGTLGSTAPAFGVSQDGVMAFMPAPSLDSRLAWTDRSGKLIRTIGDVGILRSVSLAPDERRAAVTIEVGTPPSRDIWIVDLQTGRRDRLTVDPSGDDLPVWSPDGAVVYYSSSRTGAANLFRKPLDTSPEERLQPSDRSQRPSDISRDGRVLVYTLATTTGVDIWALPLSGDGRPWPVVEGPSAKWSAALSPDGRLLAYESNESGRPEIYVRPFPTADRAVPVTTNGGSEPRWRGDGKELFFIANRMLTSVAISGSDPIMAAAPQPLFPLVSLFPGGGILQSYAVAKSGQRFLTMRAEGANVPRPLTVVTNWLAATR
jgi:Tol biopolymer transport system component